MDSKPLGHLRVIELAGVLAGPAVGMFFAELGAHVTKIENPRTGGDLTRQWKLPSEDASVNMSSYYCSVNWGKEVLMLDLAQAEGRKKAISLIQDADIVITNFKQDAAIRMGMDTASLRAMNKRLIVGEISGFGENDDRVAFDVVLQAEAGFLFMNGEPDGNPVKMPVALIDILAAHQLKEGILLALLKRETTGMGATVSVSLFDAAIASLANQATNWLMGGHIPGRMGTLHPNIAPYGEMFQTKDKKLVLLAVGTDKQFANLCRGINRMDLLENVHFQKNTERVIHRNDLSNVLKEVIAQLSATQFLDICHAHQVPAGMVRNMKEVFELDEAQKLILHDIQEGISAQRVKTTAFLITN